MKGVFAILYISLSDRRYLTSVASARMAKYLGTPVHELRITNHGFMCLSLSFVTVCHALGISTSVAKSSGLSESWLKVLPLPHQNCNRLLDMYFEKLAYLLQLMLEFLIGVDLRDAFVHPLAFPQPPLDGRLGIAVADCDARARPLRLHCRCRRSSKSLATNGARKVENLEVKEDV